MYPENGEVPSPGKIVILPGGHSNGIQIAGMEIYASRKKDGGFSHLQDTIAANEAYVFDWGLADAVDLRSLADFWLHYIRERQRCHAPEILQSLDASFQREQPTVCVAHSLGALLLLNYFNVYGVPEHIRRIVFVLADIPCVPCLKNQQALHRLQSGMVRVDNIWCQSDLILQSAYMAAGLTGIPAGLVGLHVSWAINSHVMSIAEGSLFLNPNIHTTLPEDRDVTSFILRG